MDKNVRNSIVFRLQKYSSSRSAVNDTVLHLHAEYTHRKPDIITFWAKLPTTLKLVVAPTTRISSLKSYSEEIKPSLDGKRKKVSNKKPKIPGN